MLPVGNYRQPHMANVNIHQVRALARCDGSSLLEQVTDAQIDDVIKRDIERPAATSVLLAASAINWREFEVLVKLLRGVVADGSILEYEPTNGRAWRAYRSAKRPKASDIAALADAAEAAEKQDYLARRLVTAAADIVDEAGADFDAEQRGLAVAAAIFSVIADLSPSVPKAVLDALPDDEWRALLQARKACTDEYQRTRGSSPT